MTEVLIVNAVVLVLLGVITYIWIGKSSENDWEDQLGGAIVVEIIAVGMSILFWIAIVIVHFLGKVW